MTHKGTWFEVCQDGTRCAHEADSRKSYFDSQDKQVVGEPFSTTCSEYYWELWFVSSDGTVRASTDVGSPKIR